jgi:hypothetical protein
MRRRRGASECVDERSTWNVASAVVEIERRRVRDWQPSDLDVSGISARVMRHGFQPVRNVECVIMHVLLRMPCFS